MESLRQWEERSWAWNRLFAFPLLSCCFVLTRLLPSSVLWYIWCCLSCSRYYARVRNCLEQSTLNSEVNRWGADELLDFDAPLNTQSHLRSCLLSTTCEKEVCQRQETEADRYRKDDHVIILDIARMIMSSSWYKTKSLWLGKLMSAIISERGVRCVASFGPVHLWLVGTKRRLNVVERKGFPQSLEVFRSLGKMIRHFQGLESLLKRALGVC